MKAIIEVVKSFESVKEKMAKAMKVEVVYKNLLTLTINECKEKLPMS